MIFVVVVVIAASFHFIDRNKLMSVEDKQEKSIRTEQSLYIVLAVPNNGEYNQQEKFFLLY